jgi:serine/threonine protein kinase
MPQIAVSRAGSNTDLFSLLSESDGKKLGAILGNILLSEELSTRLADPLCGSLPELLDEAAPARPNSSARGAVLFFLFHNLAVRAAAKPEFIRLMNQIGSSRIFLEFLREFHSIPPEIGLEQVGFHACGTSSLILRVNTTSSGARALKIIKPQYIGLEAIADATERYAKLFPPGATKYTAKVYNSAKTWVLMDLIEGPTLTQYLAEIRRKHIIERADRKELTREYVLHAVEVLILLADALAYYEDVGVAHGDLTPDNIIVVVADRLAVPSDIKLIDFGPNYVLRAHVGTGASGFAEAFARTKLFGAPEVVNRREVPSTRSDLYSLGVITLDVMSADELREEKLSMHLAKIWEDLGSVGIAEVVEDLVDNKPERRALILEGEHQRYVALGEILRIKIALYDELILKARDEIRLKTINLKSAIRTSLENLWRILTTDSTPYRTVGKTLFVCAVLNAIAWYLILISFLIYTTYDIAHYLGIKSPIFGSYISIIDNYLWRNFEPGAIKENLPGRLIGLTFGLIASRYYANVFSSLQVRDYPSWLQPATNALLRLNCASYFFPIMLAIVYSPSWWPFCGAAGTLLPALNNLFCRFCAVASVRAGRENKLSIEELHQTTSDRFLYTMWRWWMLMAAYCAGILVLGLLVFTDLALWIAPDRAHDAAIYAYALCIINVVQIYQHNCTKDAPGVLGNLSRLFFSLRRLNRIVKGRQPAGA